MSIENDEANVKVCKEAHKKLKIHCANNELSIKELANKIIFDYFERLEKENNHNDSVSFDTKK